MSQSQSQQYQQYQNQQNQQNPHPSAPGTQGQYTVPGAIGASVAARAIKCNGVGGMWRVCISSRGNVIRPRLRYRIHLPLLLSNPKQGIYPLQLHTALLPLLVAVVVTEVSQDPHSDSKPPLLWICPKAPAPNTQHSHHKRPLTQLIHPTHLCPLHRFCMSLYRVCRVGLLGLMLRLSGKGGLVPGVRVVQ